MSRGGRKGRPDESMKGSYGVTAPAGSGKGGKRRKGGSLRAGAFFAPPSMKAPAGTSKGGG